MESDEEIISKSALGNARKRRDPSLSYALSNVFPRADSPNRLWDVYWGYYESLLRNRGYAAAGISSSEPFGAYTSRRLILLALERIIRYYSLPSLIKGDESSEVALKNMNWLVAFSMDTKPEFTLRGSEGGPISSQDLGDMVGPSNFKSSCYCDVVIVSMFLATDAYDPIFNDRLDVFEGNPWDDEHLFNFTQDDPLSWLRVVLPNLRGNPCFSGVSMEEAKTRITGFKLLLDDFVRNRLRITELPPDETIRTWAKKQSDAITDIRRYIFGYCKGLELDRPEDASAFFQRIMVITGWDVIAFPIRVDLWTTEYSIVVPTHKLSVQATTSKTFQEFPVFKISKSGSKIRTLQSVIDANLGRQDIELNETEMVTDQWSTTHRLLKEEADLRKTKLPNVPYEVRSERRYSWSSFARIPRYVVFKLEPELETMFFPEGSIPPKWATITFPEDSTIYLPILGIPDDEGANPRIPFRVFSVVIHAPGHWWMYFRYPPDHTEAVWYKYDDTSPEITLAIPAELKHDVEDKGTLYFCQRIEQR